MESQDPTLYSIMQSLYKNNGRKSWNMHPENSGDIVLKIRFNGHDAGSKQKPNSKVKKNMIRSDKWKQQQQQLTINKNLLKYIEHTVYKHVQCTYYVPK